MATNGKDIPPEIQQQACVVVRACCPDRCPVFALLDRLNWMQEQIAMELGRVTAAFKNGTDLCDAVPAAENDSVSDPVTPFHAASPSARSIELLTSKDDRRALLARQFESFLEHRNYLRPAQFEAVKAYYCDGLSQAQIALMLGISRTLVSGLLIRARKVRDRREAELREELFLLTRRNVE